MRANTTKSAAEALSTNELSSATSQADWIRRFADCLMLVHPNTVASVVARHVVATNPADSELPPEEAALKFMFEQPLIDEASIPTRSQSGAYVATH